jgi:hypothetical protein
VYAALHENTALAVEMTSDPVWWLAGFVPVLGTNFSVVHDTAKVVDDVVVGGVGPFADVPGLSIDSLKPVNGQIDIAQVSALVPVIEKASDSLAVARRDVANIDASGAIAPLRDAVTKLQGLLLKVTDLSSVAAQIVPLLPDALGASGPRNYLLLFQNNAEERALGGNPAALALISLDAGKISLVTQATSGNFKAYVPPAVELSPEVRSIYGDLPATWVQNVSMVPDFPTVSAISTAMWSSVFPQPIDAVVSIDPIALSYLLDVTGPIDLPTGDQLAGPTAVEFLLSTVYAKYSDPLEQDVVFAAAARGAFDALSSGRGSMKGYIGAAQKMIEGERLYLWSVHPEEQAQIAQWPVSGILPVSNEPDTTVGVYFNDASSAKMSYYLTAEIALASARCVPDGPLDISTTVTLTNPVTAEQAQGLAGYVVGNPSNNSLFRGWIREDVILYGPVGGTLSTFSVDGADVAPTITGTDKGRPVAVYTIIIGTSETHSVAATWSGGESRTDGVSLRTTPRVHDTPVTVSALACG